MIFDYDDLGSGEVIVFIHGLGSLKEAWTPQHGLASDFRLIIPTLRGHGNSIQTEDINIYTFATDVIELLDKLKVDKAYFCGLSMGGLVCQEIFRRYPNRVKSLILCNTLFYSIPILADILLFKRVQEINRISEIDYKDEAVKRCLYKKSDKDMANEMRKVFKLNKEQYIKSAKSCIKQNNIFLLPKIQSPTLIIAGQYDKVTPPLLSYQMYKLIPNAELHVYGNTGHVSNIEQKTAFNEDLREFIFSLQMT